MTNVVIAGYARSPFTFARKGALARVRPDEIASQVVRGLIERAGVEKDDVEDIIMGCAFPEGEQGDNVARLVGFLAEMPLSTAGATVNRFCGSSMQSIHMAAGAIKMNAGDAFVCAGVESMTRVPMGGYNFLPHPRLAEEYPQAFVSMGITAENLAKKYKIDRKAQEAFAVASHQKAAAARSDGRFADEIVPIIADNLKVEEDGCIRPPSTRRGR
jgi:acetyl-CoA acyltransferase